MIETFTDMTEIYQEPLSEIEKAKLRKGKCPLCGFELDMKAGMVWCASPADTEDDECPFYTSGKWIKFQIGVDPTAFVIRVPKKRT